MERLKPFIIVADDGGLHPAIDRGIKEAAVSKAIGCADYMVEQPEGREAALRFRRDFPDLGLGLHIDISGTPSDLGVSALSIACRFRPPAFFRRRVIAATERQLKLFQDTVGEQPAHIGTHAHLHVDYREKPFAWFVETIQDLLDGAAEEVVVRGIDTKVIRHTRAREALLGKKPLTPIEFGALLNSLSLDSRRVVELAVHPARKRGNEEGLPTLFSLFLREEDLSSLLAIVESGVIEEAGFEITTLTQAIEGRRGY